MGLEIYYLKSSDLLVRHIELGYRNAPVQAPYCFGLPSRRHFPLMLLNVRDGP